MFYNYSYFPGSPAFPFQGNRTELERKLKETGAIVVGGSNGSYQLAIPPQGTIYEYPSEDAMEATRSIVPNKEMIRIRYGKTRVTENDYRKLVDELNKGKLQFDSLSIGPSY